MFSKEDIIKVLDNTLFLAQQVPNKNVNIEDYIEAYKKGEQFDIIQFFSMPQYYDMMNYFYSHYQEDKNFYIKIAFDSFYFYVPNRNHFINFLDFLDKIKDDFKEWSNEIIAIQNLLIEFYYTIFYDREQEFIREKIKIEKASVGSFLQHFGIEYFRVKNEHLEESQASVFAANVTSSMFYNCEKFLNNQRRFPSLFVNSSIFAYYIYRETLKNDFIDKKYLVNILQILKTHIQFIEENSSNGSLFIPSIVKRYPTILSAYYNILISLTIKINGFDATQEIALEYLEKLFFMYSLYGDYIATINKSKLFYSFIEAINYLTYLMIPINRPIRTSSFEIKNIKHFYNELVFKEIRKLSIGQVLKIFSKKYGVDSGMFGPSDLGISEIGVGIAGSIIAKKTEYNDFQNIILKDEEKWATKCFVEYFEKLHEPFTLGTRINQQPYFNLDHIG